MTEICNSPNGASHPATDRFRACNLCGSVRSHPLYEADGYHIVTCHDCGLAFVGEEVTREELDSYYGSTYYNNGTGQGYGDYLGHRDARMAHYRTLLSSIRRHVQPSSTGQLRALDVGCAAGFFLEVAGEAGWSAQGVEISPYMSAYAREERGLDVLTGTLEEADLPLGTFQLITMWDLIEHVQNPRAVLQRARDLLAPGGLLVVATGDISGATARIFGRRWGLLSPPGHLFYFSRRTLYAFLRGSGFAPLTWESDGAFLLNDRHSAPGRFSGLVNSTHNSRLGNALLRRLKLGSIMTVYARKCGNN